MCIEIYIYTYKNSDIRENDIFDRQIFFIHKFDLKEKLSHLIKSVAKYFTSTTKFFLFSRILFPHKTIKQNNSKQLSRNIAEKCMEECIAELSVSDKT